MTNLEDDRPNALFKFIDQEIENHEDIIKQHQLLVRNLKIRKDRLRNRLVPISRIPPEVLDQIFFIASRDIEGHGLQWTTLSHVCYDWRDLALSSPSLWSNPPFQSPSWAKEMLIRSKTQYLTIEANASLLTDPVKRRGLYDAFAVHMSRIKSIKITFPSRTADLFTQLPMAAPNLESLSLYCLSDPEHQPGAHARLKLQGSFSTMGRLQRLDLSRISIDWELHLPCSLTSLKLSHIHRSSLPPIAQVWDALERMPLLEILELAHALPASEEPDSSGRTVCLRRLRDLKLEAGIAETECFLQTVMIPPAAVFDVRCLQDSPTGYLNLNDIIARLGRRSAKSSLPTSECLVVQYSHHCHRPDNVPGETDMDMSSIEFLSFPLDQESISESRINQSSHFQVFWYHGNNSELEDDNNTDIPEGILRDVFQQFPFNFLNKLYLYGPFYHFSLSTLLHTFGSLPHLQNLVGQLGSRILDALQSSLPIADSEDDTFLGALGCISFRSLKSLNIQDTVFHDKPQHSRGEISIENLVDCLAWRYHHGAPLQELDFDDCENLDDLDIERLQDVVGEVEWDGYATELSENTGSEEEFESSDDGRMP